MKEESLHIEFEVILSTSDLLSLKFTHTVMAVGQMHPIDYPVTINYDLKNGKLLKLGDLFKPQANFLKIFSQYCRDELKKRYGEQLFMMDGTEAKAENYKNWNLTPEGIMISFDDYQVGPHSMGQPVLIIPHSVLQDSMARNRAMATLLNNNSSALLR